MRPALFVGNYDPPSYNLKHDFSKQSKPYTIRKLIPPNLQLIISND
jgi:hypothetical protein